MKKPTKKAANKLATKKMFAVVQAIYDREDPEDSEVKVCGVYRSKKIADQKCDEAKQAFLADVDEDNAERAESILDDDCDRFYDWFVTQTKVQV